MRQRVLGAALLIGGAALLVAAMVTFHWWAGPIRIAGKIIEAKSVFVGLLGARGCNAGDGSCVPLDLPLDFRTVGLATFGFATFTVLSALGLVSVGRFAPRSWTGARMVWGAVLGAVFTSGGAVAFILLRPARFADQPPSYSVYAAFAGALVVGLISLRSLWPTMMTVAATGQSRTGALAQAWAPSQGALPGVVPSGVGCPRCGASTAWVESQQRAFCGRCQQYV